MLLVENFGWVLCTKFLQALVFPIGNLALSLYWGAIVCRSCPYIGRPPAVVHLDKTLYIPFCSYYINCSSSFGFELSATPLYLNWNTPFKICLLPHGVALGNLRSTQGRTSDAEKLFMTCRLTRWEIQMRQPSSASTTWSKTELLMQRSESADRQTA